MRKIRITLNKKPPILRLFSISILDIPKIDKAIKNIKAGTIIYTILKTNNRIVLYMLSAKFRDGNMEDSFKPIWTNDNKYPGTIRMNTKNANAPKIMTYLLSNIMPIGIKAAKIKRMNRIGNFLIFLKGYLNEFDIIFPTSIKSPNYLNIKTGFFS